MTFRRIIRAPEPRPRRDRDAARSGYRVFRSTDGFEAAIASWVVDAALELGRRASPCEAMGLLYGTKLEDDAGPHVVVHGLVPNLEMEARVGEGFASPESDRQTQLLGERIWPSLELIAWFHTHDDVGACYSSTDRETQRQWTDDSSVGLVVDPERQPHVAVYRGPDSELLDEVVAAQEPSPRYARKRCTIPWRTVLVWVRRGATAAVVVGVAACAVWGAAEVRATFDRLRALEVRVHNLETRDAGGSE